MHVALAQQPQHEKKWNQRKHEEDGAAVAVNETVNRLRNGFRILVIGLLCVNIGPQIASGTTNATSAKYALPVLGISICLIEVGYPVFIWMKKTRFFWLVCILAMHAAIGLTMGMYLFALVMIVLNLAAFGVGISVPFIKHPARGARDSTQVFPKKQLSP